MGCPGQAHCLLVDLEQQLLLLFQAQRVLGTWPRAAPCLPLQSQGRRARSLHSLPASSTGRIWPRISPSVAHQSSTHVGITPKRPSGTAPFIWLQLCTNPRLLYLLQTPKPAPCSLRKTLCLQVEQQKQREEEPFNLFPHFHTQTST